MLLLLLLTPNPRNATLQTEMVRHLMELPLQDVCRDSFQRVIRATDEIPYALSDNATRVPVWPRMLRNGDS